MRFLQSRSILPKPAARLKAPLFATATLLLTTFATLSDTVTLQPVRDNTLYEPVPQENNELRSNGAGQSMFAGRTKEAKLRRAVLAFDVSANIPAGATIDSVQLTLRVTKSKGTSSGVKLHRLTMDWGEGTSNTGNSQQGRGDPPTTGDCTWEHSFFDTQFWTSPGAENDYSTVVSASTTVTGEGFYSWGSTSNMVSDVQYWLDNPSENFGWIMIGDETVNETAKQFATKENTKDGGQNKPELVINFTPQTTSGACCAPDDSCTIEAGQSVCLGLGAGYSYEGNGTTCSPNPCFVPTGACCADDGSCQEATEADCTTAGVIFADGGTYQGDGSSCSTVECPVILTPYVDALPVPGPATPISGSSGGEATYRITMREFTQQLHSELPLTTVWGYDDGSGASTPGPVIEARRNLPVTVEWVNDIRVGGTGLPRDGVLAQHYLDVDVQTDGSGNVCIHGAADKAKTVVHLHGGHVPAEVDGYPEHTFDPGQGLDSEVSYTYPNGQDAGYLWFHDHALGITRLNVYMGLAGIYFMRDDIEDALNIPSDQYEIPLVLQDRKFNPDGTLKYPSEWQDHWFGDKVMVNGKVWPVLNVNQGKYRFRVLNGSGSRVYRLSLAPPSGLLTFTVIGTEGGLLEAPVNGVGELVIGPGERYDVVVDFSNFNLDDEILLENDAPAPFPNGSIDLTRVMKFVVTSAAGDTDPLPASLREIERIPEGEAIVSRDFRLKRSGSDGCGRVDWLINDLTWDDITEFPELNTTEIWRFINDSGVAHPMHMHLVFFQILDRDTFTTGAGGEIIPDNSPQPPLPEEDGWKDTAMVGPNEILRVIARFEDYKGRYAYHCHILEHEDHEMMRQFETHLCGDGEKDGTDPVIEECDDGNIGNADGCSTRCEVEEFAAFSGSGSGGGDQVSMTVDGVVVTISTTNGQTPQQIAQALADAINADPTLSASGVSANTADNRVVTNGDITDVTITDAGVSNDLELSVFETRLWWGTNGGAASYDLVRGSMSTLNPGGNFELSTEACSAEDSTSTSYEHGGDVPAAGDGFWYLVRPQGTAGDTYDGGGFGQSGSRDPGIASSGNDCG
jgi:spore coat protein A